LGLQSPKNTAARRRSVGRIPVNMDIGSPTRISTMFNRRCITMGKKESIP
jgi:hypothetical protein